MNGFIAKAGLCLLTALLFSATASAATVTHDDNAGTPLISGAPVIFSESIEASTDFSYSVHFTTDALASAGSAAAVGLDLTGISGFDGDLEISLFKAKYVTGDDTVGSDLVASVMGNNLSDVGVLANTMYSFVIQGTTLDTPSNIVTGSVAVSAVPLPAAAWLFGSAVMGLTVVSRRKNKAAVA